MLTDKPILIVEDNIFLTIDLSDAILELDGTVVGPTDRVAQALELLDSEKVAAAIVDCDLPNQDVAPLTDRLAKNGVPFVIHADSETPETIGTLFPGRAGPSQAGSAQHGPCLLVGRNGRDDRRPRKVTASDAVSAMGGKRTFERKSDL